MKNFSDSNERIPDCKTGIQLTSCGYTAFCYTLMSKADWFEAIKASVAIYFSFGFFAGIYLLKTGIYLYDLVSSKNKNLSKVGAFLRELLATILFICAIIFGLFANTALSALSSIFFVLSTGVGTLYHFSIMVYAGIRYFFEKDQTLKNHYKISVIKHGVNFILFGIGITLLSCFLLTNIAPFAFGIANAVYNLGCFLFVAIMTYKARKSNATEECKTEEFPFLENPLIDYYGSSHREIHVLKNENPKDFLLSEIEKKTTVLTMELKNSYEGIFDQRKKRETKIMALLDLKKLILNPFAKRDHFEELLKKPLFHTYNNNPFQSFFKKKSDMWDIFLAARSYFNHLEPTPAYNL